jgi:hypothetical protein
VNDIKKLLDEARDKMAEAACPVLDKKSRVHIEQVAYARIGFRRGFDAAAAIIEELVEELKFYAERRHALFTEEQRQDDSLIRTRVDSVVETGWRARYALARATERLESMRGER